jgi:Cdc6-like AAA superfamily ATPase
MSQMEFQGFAPELSDEDWTHKGWELSDLFSPSAPVQESDLFAGRVDQLSRLVDTVYQRGQSAVVYGPRGVGKTSLANTFQQKIFANAVLTKFFSARCFSGDDFSDIWLRVVGRYKDEEGGLLADYIPNTLSPTGVLDLISRFKSAQRPVFIFDEFDRIEDTDTKLRMAETIKLISDEAPNATLIIVGIANTIRDLLSEHESVKRAARQIEMPRMSRKEIQELVSVRLGRVGMTMDEEALSQLATLSRGMPGYAHLLGFYSAREAIGRRSLSVGAAELLGCLGNVLAESGESTNQDYERAVHSTKPNNQLKQALLACALAKQTEFGSFAAGAVREPISRLLGGPRDIPAFARHLHAFCSDERGPVLERSGSPKSYSYRFVEPHMQTYVIIKAIKDGIIPPDDGAILANLI